MRRIRVVDDDRHTRFAIGMWLRPCGFRVAITDGGESGLAALSEGTFDLMIVDVFMPNMRGFESIRIFHERAPTVPLIAMSGYAFANLDSPAPIVRRRSTAIGSLTPIQPIQIQPIHMCHPQSARAETAGGPVRMCLP